jgi:nitrogen fixation NifU-like protein
VDAAQLKPEGPPGYSPTTIDHFRNPRNVGRLESANAVGTVDDPATENIITIYLRIEGQRVVEARFRTFGCSACIAASSVVTELARGRTVTEARAIDGAEVLTGLDGLPEGKRHCAELAAAALQVALDSARLPSEEE